MTDSSQTAGRPEEFAGGAAPDSGGSPIGDLYGSSGGAAGAGSSEQGTADTVKDEAQHVRESATDAGRHVADTAKDEARHVAGEAKQQARQLLDQSMHEVQEQAKSQQQRAAEGMHTFGDDLRGMAEGTQSGLAAQLVSEVGDRASAAARWLEEREPADLLDEVKTFARRRPGTFIAIAGVAGLLVGRLARSIMSEAKDEREQREGQRDGRASGAASNTEGRPAPAFEPAPATRARPVVVDDPYGDVAAARPGGSTRGTAVDADVPSQTGHSPSGTGMPTGRREAGL